VKTACFVADLTKLAQSVNAAGEKQKGTCSGEQARATAGFAMHLQPLWTEQKTHSIAMQMILQLFALRVLL
jgi:hypothetical protein